MSYADLKNRRKSSSLITEGMTQLHTEEVLNQELVLADVDVIDIKSGKCAVILFERYPNQFYFGGKVLTEMCEEFLADSEAMASLHNGEVTIILSKVRSANTGREYVTFEFVDNNESEE